LTGTYCLKKVEKLLCAVKALNVTFIAVTNEVGMGAGRVNQMLAKNADEVYFCVSGIPVRIK